jgi:hypothetical protein
MKVIDLDTEPDYEALSYTWGDPLVFYRNEDGNAAPDEWYKPSYNNICNGHPVSVTANLSTALLARRNVATKLTGSDGDKWAKELEKTRYRRQEHVSIDAICINQMDLAEREAQVSIMARIYSQATVVNAWLGREDKSIPGFTSYHGKSLQLGNQAEIHGAHGSVARHDTLGPSPLSSA